jgi:competence protein ComEA
MKATLFAVLLSFVVLSLPAQAVEMNTNPLVPPIEQKIDKIDKIDKVDKINLNKADANILAKSCKGIGKKRAEAIVKYREAHGNFRSVDQLAEVSGIGKQFVKRHQTQLEGTFVVE